jgi:hypothetical protein
VYRWCRPPTCGMAMTVPCDGGSVFRGIGAFPAILPPDRTASHHNSLKGRALSVIGCRARFGGLGYAPKQLRNL